MQMGYSNAQQGAYYYYNNTFVGFGYHFYLFSGNTGLITSKNNIFLGGTNNNTFFIAQNSNIYVNSIVAGTNIYWRGGNGWNLGHPSARYYTLPVWQTASGTDAGSVTGEPTLSGSYTPQVGSSAIGIGSNLTGLCSTIPALCKDKAGLARPPSGPWDAGAY